MEVILIDDVFELGKRGTVVTVADGYGRNYLIPKSLAIPATPGNRKMIEQQRLAMAKKESKYQEEAELLTQELNQLHLMLSRKSGETGTLFGSVTSKDIADLLKTTGIQLDRRKIVLNQPIKSIGNYTIEVRPHSEVTAELLLSIVAEGDEPVSKIKKKDEESDAIVAELEARLKEMKQSMATESVIPPEPEDLPTEEETKSQQEEEEEEEAPAEETAAAVEATEEAGEAKVEAEVEAEVEAKAEAEEKAEAAATEEEVNEQPSEEAEKEETEGQEEEEEEEK
ncbi:MAG: 50S ribosomal protein L9 [Acidobacteria bacterium]|nr:MAG: 50S ribosomal protein L9 [Acidobacteriota bacterium]